MTKQESDKRYYEKNKEKIKAKVSAWREKNKERARATIKEWEAKNPDKVRESKLKWKEDNQEAIKEYDKAYRLANKDRRREYDKQWKQNNTDRVREKGRIAAAIRRSTPKGKLSSNISREIRSSIKSREKANRHWEELVGYTVDQLKMHLERLFEPGMTWENYGTVWHIDHKTPIAVFNFEKPEDIDFRICWSLKNLQPMESKRNKSKGAKLTEPFQPSLAIGGKQ